MRFVVRGLISASIVLGVICTGCHQFAGKDMSSHSGDNEPGTHATTNDEPSYSEATIRSAVGKAHTVLWKGVEGHVEHRSCFTCHNHGTPMLAFATARERGFAVPEKDFADLIEFSTAYFESNRERFLRGHGPGPSVFGWSDRHHRVGSVRA